MYTSSRDEADARRAAGRGACPPGRRTGRPACPRGSPGASPTNISSASGLPDAEDDLGAALGKAAARAAGDLGRVRRLAQCPQPQLPPQQPPDAGPAVSGLLGGAVSREHGELLAHVRGVAVRAAAPPPRSGRAPRSATRTPCTRTRRSASPREFRHRSGHSAGTLRFARYPLRNWSFLVVQTIRIIGSGRVGSAVAARLRERGFELARRRGRPRPALRSRIAAIAEVAATIPDRARGSGTRAERRRSPRSTRTSAASALHPLQSFTRARGPEQLDGAYAAVTGESDEAREVGFVARA